MRKPRPEKEIIYDIACTYGDLSPEIISWDGERPLVQVEKAKKVLTAKLETLTAELGRPIGEVDAYQIALDLRYHRPNTK